MRNSETKCLRGNKIELGRLLNRQLPGLCPAENLIGPYDMSAPDIRQIWLATHGRSIQLDPVAGIAFLIAMIGIGSCILGGLYLLFRDDYPSGEAKKRRKRLLVSNWK